MAPRSAERERAGYIWAMFPVDHLVLLSGLLLILGIASSKLSSRVGLPVLALFLLVGMLAGSEGIGGIAFENYALAHGVGTIALAVILFDGGLRTELPTLRAAIRPAVTLATLGVILTAVVLAAAARPILGVTWLQALLLASIVASTDAAAVFAVFRAKNLHVRERVAATLEIESGSNDPMAVFLTIACLEMLGGRLASGLDLAWLFVEQMALGAALGWVVGRGTAVILNRVRLDAAGLYPVLTGAAALLAYGAAASAGGSGFLAVYVAGIVVGSRRVFFRRGVYMFHDGLAWLAQITMFVLLGLLSFPSRLAAVAGPALLVAGVLVVVARPLAVSACLFPFGFSPREIAFVAWGGLKGAVPIILATYPLLLGVPDAEVMFDVVFFVVFVSAVTQGWTLPAAARLLGLQRPPVPEPAGTLEITSLRDVDGDIVEYTVEPEARVVGRRIQDLAVPEGVIIAMIARGQQVIPPRGSTPILAGDHVFILLRPAVRRLVDRLFTKAGLRPEPVELAVELSFRGATRIADLEELHGIRLSAPGSMTLDEFLRARLEEEVAPGGCVEEGGVQVRALEVVNGRVETAGLSVQLTQPEDGAATAGSET